jgi:hypothetical protein
MPTNINQVVDKFVAIGALRAEVMYYGLPAWWTPKCSNQRYAVVTACEHLANRYQIRYFSLVEDSCKQVLLCNPGKSLDMALFDYLRILLKASGVKSGHIYFPPNRSIIGLSNKVVLASNVPLGTGTEYNTFLTPNIQWEKYEENDTLFIKRVLNLGGQPNGK